MICHKTHWWIVRLHVRVSFRKCVGISIYVSVSTFVQYTCQNVKLCICQMKCLRIRRTTNQTTRQIVGQFLCRDCMSVHAPFPFPAPEHNVRVEITHSATYIISIFVSEKTIKRAVSSVAMPPFTYFRYYFYAFVYASFCSLFSLRNGVGGIAVVRHSECCVGVVFS